MKYHEALIAESEYRAARWTFSGTSDNAITNSI